MFEIPNNNWDIITPQTEKMLKNIYSEIGESTYFPSFDKVLRFLKLDITKIKYVILGMDPYSSWTGEEKNPVPEATGRAFEVASVNDWISPIKQSSLRNILRAIYYKETGNKPHMDNIRKDLVNGDFSIYPPHMWFDSIESQGVVFLNCSLTVKKDTPGSHMNLWKDFISIVLKRLERQDVTWLLWGKDAEKRGVLLDGVQILSPHPRLEAFVKANPFEMVDDINWSGCIEDGFFVNPYYGDAYFESR